MGIRVLPKTSIQGPEPSFYHRVSHVDVPNMAAFLPNAWGAEATLSTKMPLWERQVVLSTTTSSSWHLSDFPIHNSNQHTVSAQGTSIIQVQKATEMGAGFGVGMKQLYARIVLSFNVFK